MKDIGTRGAMMRRRTIAALGLLTALLGIGCGGETNLRITLRLADTTRSAFRLRGDSARVQTRLDWLYGKFRGHNKRLQMPAHLTHPAQHDKTVELVERMMTADGLQLTASDYGAKRQPIP